MLYLDVVIQLQQYVTAVLSASLLPDGAAPSQVTLAQSSLLCIDLLSRAFGKHATWVAVQMELLRELLGLARSISQRFLATTSKSTRQKQSLVPSADDTDNMLKLLGSTVLCCGTICGAVKVRALPFLAVIFHL